MLHASCVECCKLSDAPAIQCRMLPHAREYDGDGRGLVVWWLMREACLVETAVPDTPEDIKKREEEKKKDERAAAAAPNFGGSNQVLSLSLSLSLSRRQRRQRAIASLA
jgi:hypothetical protein